MKSCMIHYIVKMFCRPSKPICFGKGAQVLALALYLRSPKVRSRIRYKILTDIVFCHCPCPERFGRRGKGWPQFHLKQAECPKFPTCKGVVESNYYHSLSFPTLSSEPLRAACSPAIPSQLPNSMILAFIFGPLYGSYFTIQATKKYRAAYTSSR